MRRFKVQAIVVACVLMLWLPLTARAADYSYFDFVPDFVTNFISDGQDLGFVRITVSIQVENPSDLELLQKHEPLLRAAIVKLLGDQPEERIRSLSGREEIRKQCLEVVNTLLERETGKKLAADLLFTKYLYQ